MSPTGKKLEDNVAGKYYVTDACDGCGICFSYAIQNFMYSSDSSYYFVYQQPSDSREEDDIRKAMELCPMNCIMDDGEESVN